MSFCQLKLKQPGDEVLFSVLQSFAVPADESVLADVARRTLGHLRTNRLLTPGWSNTKGGRMRVEQSLLADSWNYPALGFDPDELAPPFLKPAVEELAKADVQE